MRERYHRSDGLPAILSPKSAPRRARRLGAPNLVAFPSSLALTHSLRGCRRVLPPAGNFLSSAKESHQRTPQGTDGSLTSFVLLRQVRKGLNVVLPVRLTRSAVPQGHFLALRAQGAPAHKCAVLRSTVRKLHRTQSPPCLKGKQPKRRRWRMQRGCFEAAPRLAGANSARETAGATVSKKASHPLPQIRTP